MRSPFGKWKVSNSDTIPAKTKMTTGESVEDIFDHEAGKTGHERHPIPNQDRLGRFGQSETTDWQNVSDRVAHQTRSQGVREFQAVGRFHAQAPGRGAQRCRNAGKADNDNEACAQSFDAIVNLAETGSVYEIDEESYAGGP
mgnify:CR=1 FL=1